MGSGIIPQPALAASARDPALLNELLPFTYTIATYRNRNNYQNGIMGVCYQQQSTARPAQRPPSDSYISITYPFSTSPALRDQYQRFSSPFLRVGLLLEDMDSFAADVACRHLGGLFEGATVVTAAIESVSFSSARRKHDDSKYSGIGSGGDGLVRGGATSRAKAISGAAGALEEQQPLSIMTDFRMSGQVCWSGKSSMEVIVELCAAAPTVATAAVAGAGAVEVEDAKDDVPPAAAGASAAAAPVLTSGGDCSRQKRWTHRGFAHFVMVLRQTASGVDSSGWFVPQVTPDSDLAQSQFDAAAARAAANKAKRSSDRLLSGLEPAGDEVKLLYDLAEAQLQREIQQREERDTLARSDDTTTEGSFSTQLPAAGGPVRISSTARTHLAVMHRQDRNNAGSIFGGHLLKLAAELAYSTAVLHAGRHCEAIAMGDITFKQPVPIGCVLEFRAKVIYTSGRLLRVAVVATKHQQLMQQPSQLHASVTNDFVFVMAAAGSHPLRPVEPESLREAVQYLAAHRQHLVDDYQAPPLLLQQGMEHVLTG